MTNKIILLLALLSFKAGSILSQSLQSANKIVITERVNADYGKKPAELIFFRVGAEEEEDVPRSGNDVNAYYKKLPADPKDGLVSWHIPAKNPIGLRETLSGKISDVNLLAEPGDDVLITYDQGRLQFSGAGAAKYQLIYAMKRADDSLKKTSEYKSLSIYFNDLFSFDDYKAWNVYLDKKAAVMLSLIESYKKSLSSFASNYIRSAAIGSIESRRISRFGNLAKGKGMDNTSVPAKNRFGLTSEDLGRIFDSTIDNANSKWMRYESPVAMTYRDYLTDYNFYEATRQYGFFNYKILDSLGSRPQTLAFLYNHAKRKYSGIAREEVIYRLLTNPKSGLRKTGFTALTEAILTDYLSQPGFPEHKGYIKKYAEFFGKANNGVEYAPSFLLKNEKGVAFSNENLIGKMVILHFWESSSPNGIKMANGLKEAEKKFRGDTNVVFVHINVDQDAAVWKKNIRERASANANSINLYTGGEGKKHQAIQRYNVQSYPYLVFIDMFGKTVAPYPKPDPPSDNGAGLMQLIKQQLVQMKDGPYVINENSTSTAYWVTGTLLAKKQFTTGNAPVIQAQSDQLEKQFKITLKQSYQIEPSVFARPGKLLVLSDIEGQFGAFRKLLQSNKVMDADFNWTFGDGHLVFAGDMFDRGEQVTECLWLIYSLGEKAKRAGGYVHFVLGNHEIMNLQGDHKYVEEKYIQNAKIIGKDLISLYSENTELGKWLRTKNVVEKVGDLLFLHGGISKQMNSAQLSVQEINDLARPYYALAKKDYGNEKLNLVMSSSVGPFWYRGYYNNEKWLGGLASQAQVDSTLKNFNVNHIVTGHTIVSDTISVRYGGKIINTDVRHKSGKSEALLIEGDKFYRVNGEGEKKLLFIDDKTKMTLGAK